MATLRITTGNIGDGWDGVSPPTNTVVLPPFAIPGGWADNSDATFAYAYTQGSTIGGNFAAQLVTSEFEIQLPLPEQITEVRLYTRYKMNAPAGIGVRRWPWRLYHTEDVNLWDDPVHPEIQCVIGNTVDGTPLLGPTNGVIYDHDHALLYPLPWMDETQNNARRQTLWEFFERGGPWSFQGPYVVGSSMNELWIYEQWLEIDYIPAAVPSSALRRTDQRFVHRA